MATSALQFLSPRANDGPSPSSPPIPWQSINPISWPPSQDWDGDDGSWSSFALRVGNPGQVVRVLISTAGWNTWVVQPGGCAPGTPGITPMLTCSQSRGITFDHSRSSTWSSIGNYSLSREANLGVEVSANYGLDTVALGFSNATGGPTLQRQVVAGIQSNAFYTGIFGLNNQPSNFTKSQDVNNLTDTTPYPSFLTTMKNQNLIPSLSWSYTAGAMYRLKGVFGSLTFGGYDLSRFVQNNVTFNFAPDISRDLVVGLRSITSTETDGATISLLPNKILTFIDSTLPYIYLPIEACKAFENAFGLAYDDNNRLYTVNDTLHQSLTARNLNFTFQIGNSNDGGPTVNIVLPYASFDLLVSYPRVLNATRYFPLKRAANESQYTLGRTFLQEAYVITNYEYNNFSVSQARFDDGLRENLVAIPPADAAATTESHSRISHNAIIGLSIGLIAGLLITSFFLYRLREWFREDLRKKDADQGPEFLTPSLEKPPVDIYGVQEAENTSLRRELPNSERAPLELQNEKSPSGSANEITELPPHSPSPTPLCELGTRSTSRATSSVRRESDRTKALIYVSTGISQRETSTSSEGLKKAPRVETKISSSPPSHTSLSSQTQRSAPMRPSFPIEYLNRALPSPPQSFSTRTSRSTRTNASSPRPAPNSKYAQSLYSQTSISSSSPASSHRADADNESIFSDYAGGWDSASHHYHHHHRSRRPEASLLSFSSKDVRIMMPPEVTVFANERSPMMMMRGYPSMSSLSLSPDGITVPPGTPVSKMPRKGDRGGPRVRGERGFF